MRTDLLPATSDDIFHRLQKLYHHSTIRNALGSLVRKRLVNRAGTQERKQLYVREVNCV